MGSLTTGGEDSETEGSGNQPSRRSARTRGPHGVPVQPHPDRGSCGLVYWPRWCCDRELPDCVDDAQPSCHARKIAIRREFLGSFGAFRHSLAAVAREHQVGYSPDVDFRYHADRLSGGTSIYG